MENYYKVFSAGKFPQGDISESDVQNMAKSYDYSYMAAPLTKDHDFYGSALGWVEKVKAQGKDLYVKFKEVSKDAVEMVQSGKYKRCSIEIVDDEEKGKYLRAVSLVIFPAVRNLPDLQFNDHGKTIHRYFSESSEEVNFQQINNDNMSLQRFAEVLKLKADATEDAIIKAFNEKIQEAETAKADADAKVEEAEAKVEELETKVADLEKEVSENEEVKVNDLVEFALKSGKILKAQTEEIKAMAKSNYDACKKFLSSMPVNSLYENGKAKDKAIDTGMTYSELLKKNPKVLQAMTEEQLAALKSQDPKFN